MNSSDPDDGRLATGWASTTITAIAQQSFADSCSARTDSGLGARDYDYIRNMSCINALLVTMALSHPPQHNENKQNNEHQTKSATGIVSPPLAVRPGRERPDEQENQYN